MDTVKKELKAQMKDYDYARPMWSERTAQVSISMFCQLRYGALCLN